MILLTGAFTEVGRLVVTELSRQRRRVRAIAWNSRRVPKLPGVEVVQHNLNDVRALKSMFVDVDTLMMLHPPGPWNAASDHRLLAAATGAGLRHIVKISSLDAELLDGLDLAHEDGMFTADDTTLTVLRCAPLASCVELWGPRARIGQSVINPIGATKQGIVDPRDIAHVALRALTSQDVRKVDLVLTGPQLFGMHDLAGRVAQDLGIPITVTDMTIDAYRTHLTQSGWGVSMVDDIVAEAAYLANGGSAYLTDNVERALGRPARDFATWVREHRHVL